MYKARVGGCGFRQAFDQCVVKNGIGNIAGINVGLGFFVGLACQIQLAVGSVAGLRAWVVAAVGVIRTIAVLVLGQYLASVYQQAAGQENASDDALPQGAGLVGQVG